MAHHYVVPGNPRGLEERVAKAAEAALEHQKYVRPVDVLVGIGWLPQSNVDLWRQGRVPYLEGGIPVSPDKLSTAMHLFRRWAEDHGLKPNETAYVARTADRRPLRFSASGRDDVERLYRTHWVSPELSDKKREQLAQRQSQPPDLVVISPRRDWTCTKCQATGELLLMEDAGPVCMACAGLGHLEFLPAGNPTVTRRAREASKLSAVVVQWSRTRKRYERQGILAERDAIEKVCAERPGSRGGDLA